MNRHQSQASSTSEPYDGDFYARQVAGSLSSARRYLDHLFSFWRPERVVDLGCGRGAWLAVCGEHGVRELVGVDGGWVRQDMMLDPRIEFRQADLQAPLTPHADFDLVISLEVAEHLPACASDRFVDTLAAHGGALLFGAAFTGQPGQHHVNTRPHSFWARKFAERGFDLFDLFRPRFWADEAVEPWYRQNTFLYVRKEHALWRALQQAGQRPIEDAGFVDCVHPWLYLGMMRALSRCQALLAQRGGAGLE